MKRIVTMLLAVMLACSMSVPVLAASNEEKNIDVTVKYISEVEGEYSAAITDGAADVEIEDISVGVTDAPEGAVRLMVVPVPETEKEAWKWITESLKATANPVHTLDIYFEDQNGKRIDADGAVVTLTCTHCAGVPVVCSLDNDGTVHVLTVNTMARSSAVTFTTNGSTYYIMAEELPKHDVEIEDKPGGDVVIDNPTPETGDNVTITPDPDNGKVVDKVIVKDENGNEIPVIDNGDGTYTYEQPDGDVTIEVIFKDGSTLPPQTGDTMLLWLWWILVIASATGIFRFALYERERRTATKRK